MTREDLSQYLEKEVDFWSSKSYSALREELKELHAVAGPDAPYHVEVELLENREDYVHVAVAVCSEHVRWSCFSPLSRDFLIYRDGRVDK